MAGRGRAWWMDAAFIVGSLLFALGSLPGFSSVASAGTVGWVFFVGSIFFTFAALLQLHLAGGPGWVVRARDPAWAGSAVQLAGTVWFNINTHAALQDGLDARQELLRVWTPDAIGSVCFLVASGFALVALGHRPWARRAAWVAELNLLGSVFFMAAAIGAYVLPDTGELLDATVVNSGTFLGAVCFAVAARLDQRPTP